MDGAFFFSIIIVVTRSKNPESFQDPSQRTEVAAKLVVVWAQRNMEGRRGNDELGLTLSLFPENSYGCGLQSKFSSESSSSPGALPLPLEFSSERNPATYGDEGMHFLKRIDVNRPPKRDGSGYEDEEEDGVAASSSPSSTVSSHSLSATKRGAEADLSEEDRISCRERNAAGRDEEDSSRKKLRLSKDQSALLEESFKQHPTLNPKQKMSLAKLLSLRPRQVEVWFQNRRARTKLKQTEVDCEFLKRCCENLTAENRRLQRELQELRALKMSPQFYMPVPATTLTMCPSCDKFGATSAGAPAVRPMRFQVLDMPSRT